MVSIYFEFTLMIVDYVCYTTSYNRVVSFDRVRGRSPSGLSRVLTEYTTSIAPSRVLTE